jgi:hypothetical protein
MSEMVRKQVYIHRRQEMLLKRLARLRGTSEAEVIRQAIDHEGEKSQPLDCQYDPSAWDEIIQMIEGRKKLGITSEAYQWNRQEIYAERENRWLRDRSPEKD